jgi:hypothetical protein
VAKSCTIPGCGDKHLAKGLCLTHYTRKRKHGDPLIERKPARTAEERFWAKVDKNGPLVSARPDLGPCWVWTVSTRDNGYGQFNLHGRMLGAHRIAYLFVKGSVPDDLQLDHLCHTYDPDCPGGNDCLHRRCVNPDHLEPVTQRVNLLRGQGFVAKNAAKTHCKHGHPFNSANTRLLEGGGRLCRECNRERKRVKR